jgi:hypothetical protein
VQDSAGLDSKGFDAETREMLGLDDIDEIVENLPTETANGVETAELDREK